MKGYKDVELINDDRFFDRYNGSVTPVAVELTEHSELLTQFEHPENALLRVRAGRWKPRECYPTSLPPVLSHSRCPLPQSGSSGQRGAV